MQKPAHHILLASALWLTTAAPVFAQATGDPFVDEPEVPQTFPTSVFDNNADVNLNATGQLRGTLQTPEPPRTRAQIFDDDAIDLRPDGSPAPLTNTRVRPIGINRGRPQDDPYAPLGIRSGRFTLFPVLTQSLGYTSNARDEEIAEGAAFSQSQVQLRAISDWSIHQLTLDGSVTYLTFLNGTADDLPQVEFDGELRVDHSARLTARYGISYDWTTESFTSENLAGVAVEERPGLQTVAARAEFDYRPGALGFNLRGSITRTDADNANLAGGGVLDQGDRNGWLGEAALRTTWESGAVFRPYTELGLGTRRFDRRTDSNGDNRNAVLGALRGGLLFDRGDKLSGFVQVGYSAEMPEGNGLDTLQGVTFDANLEWSPYRNTRFTGALATDINTSTVAGSTGSYTYAGTLGVVRDLRENLSLNAQVGLSLQTFDDSRPDETTLQLEAGAEWRMNRTAALFGRVGYEHTDEGTGAANIITNKTGLIGIRLSR